MTQDSFEEGLEKIKTASDTLGRPRKVSDVGIWQYVVEDEGPDRTIWDESLERLYGIEPGSFEGTHEAWMEYVHPEDIDKADEEWWRAIEEDRPFQMVYRIVRPDGQVRWVDSRALMLTDDEGNLERAVGMETDITQRLQQFQQLQITDRVLRHDFRTALSVIQAYAEQIENRTSDPTATHATKILSQIDGLLESIKKHRALSTVLAAESNPVPTRLGPVIRRAIQTARDEFASTNGQIVYADSRVPDVTVAAVETLDAALEEVLRNAIVHNDRAHPSVVVEVHKTDKSVRVEVRDDGPGIPDTEQEVVLGDQPIDSLHHLSGLGLWLVVWTVRRSGGDLAITDNEPRGTVVSLELPLAVDD